MSTQLLSLGAGGLLALGALTFLKLFQIPEWQASRAFYKERAEDQDARINNLSGRVDTLEADLAKCHDDHHVKDRALARMERALILADIPLPD